MFGRQVAAGVHMMGAIRNGMSKGGYSRSYLFEDGDELVLVDTGWDEDASGILRYLDDIGRSPSEIKSILLTHAHRSHLGGVARLAAVTGASVRAHETEAPIIEGEARAKPIALWPPIPPQLIPFRIASRLPFANHKPCEVDPPYLAGGERIGPLTVIHTPGHTPGHLVFRYRDSALAVGDAVATWPKFGPGWPGFNQDERQYRQSLRRVVELEPDVVCPGHGDAIIEDTAVRLRTLIRDRRSRGPRA